jgi:toxin ParE1/3/4
VKFDWLSQAARSLPSQLDWAAARDPWVDIDLGDAVHAAVALLAEYPAMAPPGRFAGTRELLVVGTPYIVVYRIEPSAVVILRVLHTAQRTTLAPDLTTPSRNDGRCPPVRSQRLPGLLTANFREPSHAGAPPCCSGRERS